MTILRSTLNCLDRIVLSCVLISLISLGLLQTSPHAVRAAFIPIREISDASLFEQPPHSQHPLFFYESLKSNNQFRKLAPAEAIMGGQQGLESLLKWFGQMMVELEETTSPNITEVPMLIWNALHKDHQRGDCYNDAILFCSLAQATGYLSRIVEFSGADGLGGSNHSASEVWLADLKRWCFVDPQQVALVCDGGGLPLSASALRSQLLRMTTGEAEQTLEIRQYPGFLNPREKVFSFYRKRIIDLYYLQRADFQTTYEQSPSVRLAACIESHGMGSHHGLYRNIGRFIRSTIGGPFVRYRLVDQQSPPCSFRGWYWLGRLMLAIWFFSLLYCFGRVLAAIVRIRGKQVASNNCNFGGGNCGERVGRTVAGGRSERP